MRHSAGCKLEAFICVVEILGRGRGAHVWGPCCFMWMEFCAILIELQKVLLST